MNTIIFGSGFGLYGYLPAIYHISKIIFLNEKYKKVFLKRKELCKFKNKIVWYSKLFKIQNSINYVVIAKRPEDQTKILKKILHIKKNIKHIFLEKPLNINPKKSLYTLRLLIKNKINYSIGFLFVYLNWFKILKNKYHKEKRIDIIWYIKKIKKNNNWKYNNKVGGGIIRYYGIHLANLAFSLKYLTLNKNTFNKNNWNLNLVKNKDNHLFIKLKFSNKNKFIILINKKKIIDLKNPFIKKISNKNIDPRSAVLKKYIFSNLLKYKNNNLIYLKFIKFCNKIENIRLV